MAKTEDIILWGNAEDGLVPSELTQPQELVSLAARLTTREQKQVSAAFERQDYELATPFVWQRAMASLKRELGSLGLTFLGELLGRPDIGDDDDVLDVITEREAIKLAEELGMVSRTEAIRLRQAQELVSHFTQRDPGEGEEPMLATEAVNVLGVCVRNVLAKPQVRVARKFADFRRELESETLAAGDRRCADLLESPYFFRRVAVSVLLSGIRIHTGAKLEHCLANLNQLLPLLWPGMRDPERWQVGTTYAQVYSAGLEMQTSGLKSALLKVRGFDYVPENLRSQTFLQAAQAIIRAHEGMNNFYTEESPTLGLEALGAVPAPALGPCMTALLCVRLGNQYGVSWAASPIAERVLRQQNADRWLYYLGNVLPGETRILDKLLNDKPRRNWLTLMRDVLTVDMVTGDKTVNKLLAASQAQDSVRVEAAAARLIRAYYERPKERHGR